MTLVRARTTVQASTFALVLIAAVLLPSLATAGTEETPEITDPVGDVHPTAVVVQMPSDAAVVQHAELYDLSKVYVAGEDEEAFVLRMVVDDLPDSWILPNGQSSAPLPRLYAGEKDVVWDDSLLNSKVNLTTYFTIKNKAYRVVATLAEINLDNPNKFPAADSAKLIDARFNAARNLIDQQSDTALGLLPSVVGSLDPKTEIRGHLATARTQLNAAHAVLNSTHPEDVSQQAKDQIDQRIDLAREAIADADEANDKNVPAGSVHDQLAAKFVLLDEKLAQAQKIAQDLPAAGVEGSSAIEDPEAPRVLLFHRLSLIDSANRSTPLEGLVDLEEDFVQVRVPKANVGSPVADDLLTKFRAASTYRTTFTMDLAPDGTNPSPNDSPLSLVSDASTGKVVKPKYGSDYRFLYSPPAPEPEPGPTETSSPIDEPGAGRLELTADVTEQAIAAGTVASYDIEVRNVGDAAIEGFFGLSNAADGWTHQLSQSDWRLAAGDAIIVTLSVSGIEGGAIVLVTQVSASVTGGGTEKLTFTTSLESIDDDLGGIDNDGDGIIDGPDRGDQPVPGAGQESKKKRTPGVEATLLVIALAAVGAVLRRKRA